MSIYGDDAQGQGSFSEVDKVEGGAGAVVVGAVCAVACRRHACTQGGAWLLQAAAVRRERPARRACDRERCVSAVVVHRASGP